MDEQQTDFILLYIDNDPHALAHAMKEIGDNIGLTLPVQIRRFETFVKGRAASIIGKRDHETARLLRKEISLTRNYQEYRNGALANTSKGQEYWTGVYWHYRTQYNEGNHLSEYLE